MASVRQEKIAALLKREMSLIFQQEGPSISRGGMITVTTARVSPDLSVAKIYLSIFAVKDKQESLDRIRKQAPYLRGLLGKRVGKQLRHIPELIFYLDDTLDQTDRIEELLKK